MTKPILAVIPLVDQEKDAYWMLPGYMKGIEKAGGIPVMLPLTTEPAIIALLAGRFDGFVLTGGQDVSPALYGEKQSSQCGETCMQRDEMERLLLKDVLAADKPVLGICRGLQFLNAALGGHSVSGSAYRAPIQNGASSTAALRCAVSSCKTCEKYTAARSACT